MFLWYLNIEIRGDEIRDFQNFLQSEQLLISRRKLDKQLEQE